MFTWAENQLSSAIVWTSLRLGAFNPLFKPIEFPLLLEKRTVPQQPETLFCKLQMLMWHKHTKEKHQGSSGLQKSLPASWNWVWVWKGSEEQEQQEETVAVELHKPAQCQKYSLKNRDTWQQIDLRLCLIQSSNRSHFSPHCHSESPQPRTLVSSWNCCSAGCYTQNLPQSKVHQQRRTGSFSLKQKSTNAPSSLSSFP